MMEVKTYVMGPVQTNTYLLSEGNEVLLIDPDGKAEKLLNLIDNRKLTGILLTHGHFDHIKAVDGLYERFHCPVYLHEDDEFLARDKHAGRLFGIVSYISCPTIPFKEGRLDLGPFSLEVIFTPGHTPGSVIFVFNDAIFTGDTLFKGSVGRTDLEGGNARVLKQSLEVFHHFSKDYIIYPGHDQATTLYKELAENYFLQR